MTKPILLVAAAALIDRDNRVLISKRPEGKSLAGLWEFPGGKVDPGETPEECAAPRAQGGAGHRGRETCLPPSRLRATATRRSIC